MALRSLRSRVVVGSLLWTIGITAVVSYLATEMVHRLPRHAMGTLHWTLLGITAVGLLAAGLSQVRSGLQPFHELRARLAALREGRARRIEGRYPSEIQPLVDDLNAMLEDREQRVQRAMARAGDLAHGLKTPLAVLAQDAERAEAAGQEDLAAHLSEQIERMRRQVDYHIAQARAAASGTTSGVRSPVDASAQALARTLLRLHAERALTIQVSVPAGHTARVQREDLDEMLGNLLDNACQWARTRVAVESTQHDGFVVITVDDDGPGLAPGLWDAVLQRGVRADESVAGSGFGLAIVRDLAELYGGAITLGPSPLGGLRANLRLP